jgi:hypothetical protein
MFHPFGGWTLPQTGASIRDLTGCIARIPFRF